MYAFFDLKGVFWDLFVHGIHVLYGMDERVRVGAATEAGAATEGGFFFTVHVRMLCPVPQQLEQGILHKRENWIKV